MFKLLLLAGIAAGAIGAALLREPVEVEAPDGQPESPIDRYKLKAKLRLREAQLAAREAFREKEAEVMQNYEETAHLHHTGDTSGT